MPAPAKPQRRGRASRYGSRAGTDGTPHQCPEPDRTKQSRRPQRLVAHRSGMMAAMALAAFKGWPERALEFYEGLEADNSKAYWLDHKDVYERDVKAPMEALLAELSKEFGDTRLFRPYRDVRFSRDKSPYKTTIAGMVGDHYIQLSADGLLAGAGMYHLEPPPARALPRRRRGRGDRTQAAVARRRRAQERARRPRHRRAEDGAQGLPARPPAGGAAALQGSGGDEVVAARRVAGHRGGQEAGRRRLPRRPADAGVARDQRRGSSAATETAIRRTAQAATAFTSVASSALDSAFHSAQ